MKQFAQGPNVETMAIAEVLNGQMLEEDEDVVSLLVQSKDNNPKEDAHDSYQLSYPNFVRGPSVVGMRPSFDHFEVLGTHR